MTAAETYAARLDAVSVQRLRIHGLEPLADRGPVAQRLRCDPHRRLDANLQVVASYTSVPFCCQSSTSIAGLRGYSRANSPWRQQAGH